MAHFIQTPLGSHFASFEKFGYLSAGFYGGLSEGNAGIDLGIILLLTAGVYEGQRLLREMGRATAHLF